MIVSKPNKKYPLKLQDVLKIKSILFSNTKRGFNPIVLSMPVNDLDSEKKMKCNTVYRSHRYQTKHDYGHLNLISDKIRLQMVERIRNSGIHQNLILEAFQYIPRHLFVDTALAAQAYEEIALPIGEKQTISKPTVIAYMLSQLLVDPTKKLGKVLEIGTGCGYQSAILSYLADEVYSIERIKSLLEKAKNNLRPLQISNIRLHYGDGQLGLHIAAPYDAIVLAAAGLSISPELIDQLAIGGRLIAPIGEKSQQLVLIEKVSSTVCKKSFLKDVYFVPMKTGVR